MRPSRPQMAVLAMLASLATFSIVRFRKPDMLEAMAWGLCLAASMIGYGSLLAKLCFPTKRVPLPMRLVWGAGALVGLGSVVTATRAMSHAAGIVIVLIGAAGASAPLGELFENALARTRRRWRWGRRAPFVLLLALLVPTLVVLAYVSGVTVLAINGYDDELAYMTFPKQMLQTGASDDPFSLRRVASYGGLSFLQALFASSANIEFFGTVDRGIFFATSIALLRARLPGLKRPPTWLSFALFPFLYFLQNVSLNNASNFSALAGFVVLFRTLQLVEHEPEPAAWWIPRRAVVLCAVLGTMLGTFRQNFLPMVVIVLASDLIMRAIRDKRWSRMVVDGLALAALSLLLLAGWMYQIKSSSGTVFFPLQPGNLRAAYAMRSPTMTPMGELHFIWDGLRWHEPFVGWPLALLAVPLLPVARKNRLLAVYALGSLASYLFLAHSFTLSDAVNFARYSFSFVMGTMLCTLIVWGESFAPARAAFVLRRQAAAWVVPCVFAAACIGQTRDNLRWVFESSARYVIAEPWRGGDADVYRRAQATIPRGATVLMMVDEPYRFDYATHRLLNIDVPGAVSPAPGIPFFGPVKDVETYLLNQGIRYLAVVTEESSHANYVRPYWFDRLYYHVEIWRRQAPYYIYIIDAFDELARRHRHLFDAKELVVVDLMEPNDAPEPKGTHKKPRKE